MANPNFSNASSLARRARVSSGTLMMRSIGLADSALRFAERVRDGMGFPVMRVHPDVHRHAGEQGGIVSTRAVSQAELKAR